MGKKKIVCSKDTVSCLLLYSFSTVKDHDMAKIF